MDHPELLRLVEAHERAHKEIQISALAVWAALVEAEPELAGEVLRLFGTADAAAQWAASSFSELGDSPARQAAEGHAASILNVVRKTDHGFVG
jgi:hypothetical protein